MIATPTKPSTARLTLGNSGLPSLPAASSPPPPPISVREPTPGQRSMLRGLLDRHFDADDGMYLDGLSDQALAERVNVPRVVVERMREAAYGPIRVSPEMVAIRTDAEKLSADIRDITAMVADLNKAGAAIMARIEQLIRKGGNPAPGARA